jgi:thiol:disulfide interchange protein
MLTTHRLALLFCAITCVHVCKTAFGQEVTKSAPVTEPRDKQIAWQTNYDTAARQATTAQKPMLVQITAGWCTYCVKMSRETYHEESIVRHVNQCFIPIKIDAESQPEFLRQVDLKVLPTTLIVSPDLTITQRLNGYQSALELEKHLREYCRSHAVAPCDPRKPTIADGSDLTCAVCAGIRIPTTLDHACLKCLGTFGLLTWSPSAGFAIPLNR